jgi:hypothetical protein
VVVVADVHLLALVDWFLGDDTGCWSIYRMHDNIKSSVTIKLRQKKTRNKLFSKWRPRRFFFTLMLDAML